MKFLRRRFFPPPALFSSLLITLARYSAGQHRDFTTKPFQRNRSYLASSLDRTFFANLWFLSPSSSSSSFFSPPLSLGTCVCNIREFRPIKLIAFKFFFFSILKGIYFCRRRERDDDNVAQVLERPLSKWGGRQVEAERREIDCLNGRKRREREGRWRGRCLREWLEERLVAEEWQEERKHWGVITSTTRSEQTVAKCSVIQVWL